MYVGSDRRRASLIPQMLHRFRIDLTVLWERSWRRSRMWSAMGRFWGLRPCGSGWD